ncbi:MAG TPA: hypothetical protein VGD08_09340 [Stellaceae bacterium]|jgi:hypothetical protein
MSSFVPPGAAKDASALPTAVAAPAAILPLVGDAYRFVLNRLPIFAEMAVVPLAAILLAEYVGALLERGVIGYVLAALLRSAALIVFGSVVFVRWHRFVLLGEVTRGVERLFGPGWRPFATALLILTAIPLVYLAAASLLVVVYVGLLLLAIAPLLGIAFALASVRVALVFPAASIERPLGWGEAWALAAGHYLKLLGGGVLCAAPFGIAFVLLHVIGERAWTIVWMVTEALALAVTYVGGAVCATYVSELYRRIVPGAPIATVR